MFLSIYLIPQPIGYNLIMYPIIFFPGSVLYFAVITYFLHDYKANHFRLSTKTDNTFKVCCCLKNQIRDDISFNCLLVDDSNEKSRYIFSLKFKQYITKVYSAICHDRRFKG